MNLTDGPVTFIKDDNLWLREEDGQEIRLSSTGTAESPFSNFTYFAPNFKSAVVFQTTPVEDHTVYQVESSPRDQLQSRLKQFQYLKSGDRVSIDRPRMFDLTTKQVVPTDDAIFSNPYRIDPLSGSGWNAEGTEFRFVFNQRGHQVLRVVGINTQGRARAVLEEMSKTFIDYVHKLYYRLTNSSEMGGTIFILTTFRVEKSKTGSLRGIGWCDLWTRWM